MKLFGKKKEQEVAEPETADINVDEIDPMSYMSYAITGQHREVFCPICGYRQKTESGIIPTGLTCPVCSAPMLGNLT